MQLKNWNDLRYLIAIKRGATITAAARLLSVDDTTVSRRLSATKGCIRLDTILPAARREIEAHRKRCRDCAMRELMERQVDLANESLGAGHGQYAGSVELTSVPIVANRLLVPAIGKLLDKHPALQLELIEFTMPRRRCSPFSQASERHCCRPSLGRESRLQRLETDARSPLPLRDVAARPC
jgi:hypothetical protein